MQQLATIGTIADDTPYRRAVRPTGGRSVAQGEHPESLDAAPLRRQLADSLDQLQATSEVLAVIGRGAFELDPVFETVARHALRLCSADIGIIWQRAGDRYQCAHLLGGPPAYQALMDGARVAATRGTMVGRVGLERPGGRRVRVARAHQAE
jgi:hypothetical protein